jgi:hypothetical protein
MQKIAVVLIAAHAIADFFLQTDTLAQRKNRPGYLTVHALIHAALSYIALQAWLCWQAPVFVFGSHLFIDFVKQGYKKDTATVFSVDQIVHILSLLLLAWLLVKFLWLPAFTGSGYRPFVVFAGFVATVRGSGFLVAKFAKQLIDDNNLKLDGLLNGGKWIGHLERCLIFLFIFIDQPAGIGFLVAAKSILRFEEAKQQKLAEYILIGSLLSFSLAIALASVTKWATGH